MGEHPKTDFSEIARLILDGIVAFPKEFLVSFCLPHDCFRDRKYSPDEETVRGADRWMAQKAPEDNARLSGNWGRLVYERTGYFELSPSKSGQGNC